VSQTAFAEGSEPIAARASSENVVANPRLFVIRVLNFFTNHVINLVPSYRLRTAWYSRILGISIGRGTAIHLGCYIWFYGPSQIRRAGVRIGDNCRINRDCTLDVREGLVIGDNVSVSAEVFVLGAAGRVDGGRSREESAPVVIEDHAWIGVRAVIMPGVRIGSGAIVGAGAVVTRDVPPRSIVFGNPARPVATRPEEEVDYVLDAPFPLFE
jgi:acetyltransferase-like isoleucine patch superfamily enzyme